MMDSAFLTLLALLLAVLAYDVVDTWRLTDLARRRAKPAASPKTTEYTPWVDIIIPVYNMGATVERTLNSVAAATYPHCRVIVVDDGSDDGLTPQVLARLPARIDILETVPHGGKAAAVNHGLSLTQGDIVMVLDADSYVRADFIEVTLRELTGDVDAIDFVQQVANPDASAWTRLAYFEREILTLRPDNFGALFAIRRPVFEALKFVDCLSPQFEINARLRAQSRLKISPEPVVYSDEPTTFRRAYRRKRRWVFGWLESQARHGAGWDFHVWMPFADMALLLTCVLTPIAPEFFFFPAAIWLLWTIKSLWLSAVLKLPTRTAWAYPVYMTMLLCAAVEATVRFKLQRRVAWT